MLITKMKRCRCGSLVERHKTANGGWIVYCPDCISGELETAEQAAIAWNEWIGGGDDDER